MGCSCVPFTGDRLLQGGVPHGKSYWGREGRVGAERHVGGGCVLCLGGSPVTASSQAGVPHGECGNGYGEGKGGAERNVGGGCVLILCTVCRLSSPSRYHMVGKVRAWGMMSTQQATPY